MKTNSKNRGIFFDFDGVLVDTEPIYFETLNTLFTNMDKPPLTPSEYGNFIGKPTSVTWEYLAERYDFTDSVDYQQSIYKDILKMALKDQMVLRDDARPILDSLADHKLGSVLVTSGSQEWTYYKLNILGLVDYFDCVVTGDDVAASKPDPEIYLLAAKKSGFDVSFSLAIEDSISGIESSKAAGLFTIGLKTPLTGSFDLSEADILVDNLSEIKIHSILDMIESKNIVHI